MAEWKYVIFQVGDRKVPIIFPGSLVHLDIYSALAPLLTDGHGQGYGVVSAGEVGLMVSHTSGRSTTLNIEANARDARTINVLPYSGGVTTALDETIERMLTLKFLDIMLQGLKDE